MQGVRQAVTTKPPNPVPALPAVEIHPTASVSPDARITPSVRGSRIVIGAHSFIYDFVVIRPVGGSGDIVIGEHCYLNPHTVIYSGHGVKLGNYVMVAPGVKIVPANHAFASREIEMRHQGFMPSKGGVVIEDDVWLGANAVLLDGTYIERGAIIAAGSVVSGRVDAYSIWGGVPAKKIGMRPE